MRVGSGRPRVSGPVTQRIPRRCLMGHTQHTADSASVLDYVRHYGFTVEYSIYDAHNASYTEGTASRTPHAHTQGCSALPADLAFAKSFAKPFLPLSDSGS